MGRGAAGVVGGAGGAGLSQSFDRAARSAANATRRTQEMTRAVQMTRREAAGMVADFQRSGFTMQQIRQGAFLGATAGAPRAQRFAELIQPRGGAGRAFTAAEFAPERFGPRGAAAFRQLGQAADFASGAIQRTNLGAQRLSEAITSVGRNSGGAFGNVARGARTAGNQLNRMARFAKLTQSVLEAYILYRGFVFLSEQAQQLINALSEIEFAAAQVQTQLGGIATVDFRGTLEQNVIDVARTTGQSFEALGQAQFDIISANIALEDSFGVLEATARAAVAGGVGEMETVFNAAVTQANAFNISIDQTDEILDKQFQALRRGIFTYEQFVTVLGRVSTAFGTIGQDIETANAAIAAISQIFTGPQLEFGATGLRNMALALGQQSEEFERLGVAVFDQNGEFRNFLDIMIDLRGVLDSFTEEERFRALGRLFPDIREQRGAQALLNQLDEFEQFLVEQQFAAGSVNAAFETMNDTFRTQANILESNLVPAGEVFFDTLSDIVGVVNALEDALEGATAAMLTLALTGGVAGAGRAFAPGMFQRGSLQRLGMGRLSTTGVGGMGIGGLALAGLGGFLSFQQAQQPGFQPAGAIGNIAAGALGGGIVGGVPGALLGGGAAFAGTLLGELDDALTDDAPEVAQSFSEAFREALEEDADDVSNAFTQALAGRVAGGRDLATLSDLLSRPGEDLILTRREQTQGIAGFLQRNLPQGAGFGSIALQQARLNEPVGRVGIPGDFASAALQARQARTRALRGFQGLSPFTQDFLERQQFGPEQAQRAALEAELNSLLPITDEVSEEFKVFREQLQSLLTFIAESNASADQVRSSFDAFNESMSNLRPRFEELTGIAEDERTLEQQQELIAIQELMNSAVVTLVRSIGESTGALDELSQVINAELRPALNSLSEDLGAIQARAESAGLDTLAEGLDRLVTLQANLEGVGELQGLRVGGEDPFGGRLTSLIPEAARILEAEIQEAQDLFAQLNDEELLSLVTGIGEAAEEAETFAEVINLNSGNLLSTFEDAQNAIQQGLVEAPDRFGQQLEAFSQEFRRLEAIARVAGVAQTLQQLFTLAGRPEDAARIGGGLQQFLGGNLQSLAEGLGVPQLQSGGIVTRPTFALIGEAGPEAVVPLDEVLPFQHGGAVIPMNRLTDSMFTQPFNLLNSTRTSGSNSFFRETDARLRGNPFAPRRTTRSFAEPTPDPTPELRQQIRTTQRDVLRSRRERVEAEERQAEATNSTANFFEKLLAALLANGQPEDLADQFNIPGATFLNRSMMEAADAIEAGLVDPMGFTATQLRGFGDDLTEFNRIIRQAELIEEFERVAGLVQPGVDLSGTIQGVIGRLQLGGDTLAALLDDPERLAELLSNVEFSDINVDNSQNNNFVIRISGGVSEDAGTLSRIADQLVEEINQRTRREFA